MSLQALVSLPQLGHPVDTCTMQCRPDPMPLRPLSGKPCHGFSAVFCPLARRASYAGRVLVGIILFDRKALSISCRTSVVIGLPCTRGIMKPGSNKGSGTGSVLKPPELIILPASLQKPKKHRRFRCRLSFLFDVFETMNKRDLPGPKKKEEGSKFIHPHGLQMINNAQQG